MDWDLSPFFPGIESEAYARYEREIERDGGALATTLEGLATLTDENVSAWRRALLRYEELLSRYSHLRCYLFCLRAYDARDPAAMRAESRSERLGATMSKLRVELVRGFGPARPEVIETFLDEDGFASTAYFVERLRREAERSMPPALEGLAADLAPDGIGGWGRLYDSLSGRLAFTMRFPDGREQRLSMSQRRALMRDGDRRVRQAAFEAGNEAWRELGDVFAAAINHIAGWRLTLYARRGRGHFLDAALDQASISKATLEAMLAALEAQAEIPRRFLRLKARLMKEERVRWYDLEAPLPLDAASPVPWERGKALVGDAFGAAYPALAAFYDRVIAERWVEHQPRDGKQPGAFCASSPVLRQSRVFMTYQDTLGDVSTLAHEVGHGFHSHLMRDQRMLATRYPMTLAESASTFAELILAEQLARAPRLDDAQRAVILGSALGDAALFLLDIPTRFRFEEALYSRRREGELSVGDLDELMRQTQRHVFGDVLEEGGEDPLFWASKLHFFITSVSFYNFPYTFGYLLSRGMRAMHAEEGDSFLPRYEAFLRASGSDWAHRVARGTLGCDLESTSFWTASITSLERDLDELESLLARLGR
jgi:oligoendopeptidase F